MRPKLQSSEDYKKFRRHKLQRELDQRHVRRIAADMKENGFYPSMPLTVRAVGKSFEIIDGHHRYEAAKLSKKPLYFVEAVNGEHMAVINSLQKSWSLQNWLTHYVRAKKREYVRLYQLLQKHDLSLNLAIALCSGNLVGGGNHTKKFKEGNFKVITETYIQTVAKFRDDCAQHISCTKSGRFPAAFAPLLGVEGFDVGRLLKGIARAPHLIERKKDKEGFLEGFEACYNHNYKNVEPLAFLAQQASKGRASKILNGKRGVSR